MEAKEYLKHKIDRLPYEKLGKAMSYLEFLEQEPEPELILSAEDEAKIAASIEADEFVDAKDMLAVID